MPSKPRAYKRICVNEKCRAVYTTKCAPKEFYIHGMCPKCKQALASGKPWLVDADLYAKCQKIAKQERRQKHSTQGVAAADRKRLARLAKKPLHVPVLSALEYLSDGYVAGVDNGKRGGPSGKDK